eukprot:4773189-Alexandrium_andersonii.AAC.1
MPTRRKVFESFIFREQQRRLTRARDLLIKRDGRYRSTLSKKSQNLDYCKRRLERIKAEYEEKSDAGAMHTVAHWLRWTCRLAQAQVDEKLARKYRDRILDI